MGEMAEPESRIPIEDCPKDLLLFRAAVRKIFRDISESVSEDEFSQSWTILKQRKKISQQLYKSMVDNLYENMEICMDEFIAEENLIEKFKTLQRLSEESDTPEDHIAWRPPGDVMEHLRSLDAEKTREHLKRLEDYVTTMEAVNQKLVQEVAKGRAAAKNVDQKADRLLNRQKRVRLEFERTAKQLESDIKKMH